MTVEERAGSVFGLREAAEALRQRYHDGGEDWTLTAAEWLDERAAQLSVAPAAGKL